MTPPQPFTPFAGVYSAKAWKTSELVVSKNAKGEATASLVERPKLDGMEPKQKPGVPDGVRTWLNEAFEKKKGSCSLNQLTYYAMNIEVMNNALGPVPPLDTHVADIASAQWQFFAALTKNTNTTLSHSVFTRRNNAERWFSLPATTGNLEWARLRTRLLRKEAAETKQTYRILNNFAEQMSEFVRERGLPPRSERIAARRTLKKALSHMKKDMDHFCALTAEINGVREETQKHGASYPMPIRDILDPMKPMRMAQTQLEANHMLGFYDHCLMTMEEIRLGGEHFSTYRTLTDALNRLAEPAHEEWF